MQNFSPISVCCEVLGRLTVCPYMYYYTILLDPDSFKLAKHITFISLLCIFKFNTHSINYNVSYAIPTSITTHLMSVDDLHLANGKQTVLILSLRPSDAELRLRWSPSSPYFNI